MSKKKRFNPKKLSEIFNNAEVKEQDDRTIEERISSLEERSDRQDFQISELENTIDYLMDKNKNMEIVPGFYNKLKNALEISTDKDYISLLVNCAIEIIDIIKDIKAYEGYRSKLITLLTRDYSQR